MARLFGKEMSRSQILERVGDIQQIAGVRPHTLVEGRQKGVLACDVRTGAGFRFTVVPDRALDISLAGYCGKSLCYYSGTGETAPAFYEPQGLEWLRGFFGGLLTTCGLTHAGAPSEDEGEALGIHGRVSNIPAQAVHMDGRWEGDDYVMWVEGRVREVKFFGPNVQLTRRIETRLGENRLWIRDVVENMDHAPTPHMILYHFNAGFPLVDEGAELVLPPGRVTPRDPRAREGVAQFNEFIAPEAGFEEQVYFHKPNPDEDGFVTAALVNRGLEGGLGLYVRYRPEQLPNLIEWKMMGQGAYAVGIEPANCLVMGRAVERERGTLQFLQAGEVRQYDLEVGVLTSGEEIDRMIAEIQPEVV